MPRLGYATGEQRKEYREKLNALIRQAEEIKRPGYFDTVLAGIESAVKNKDITQFRWSMAIMGELREPYTKIPKEVFFTQSVMESGSGAKPIATDYLNLFGLLDNEQIIEYSSLEFGIAAYDLNYHGQSGRYAELFDLKEEEGNPIWNQWMLRLNPDDLGYSGHEKNYGEDLVKENEGGFDKYFK